MDSQQDTHDGYPSHFSKYSGFFVFGLTLLATIFSTMYSSSSDSSSSSAFGFRDFRTILFVEFLA